MSNTFYQIFVHFGALPWSYKLCESEWAMAEQGALLSASARHKRERGALRLRVKSRAARARAVWCPQQQQQNKIKGRTFFRPAKKESEVERPGRPPPPIRPHPAHPGARTHPDRTRPVPQRPHSAPPGPRGAARTPPSS